jgi:Putative transmembrane protein (PGPGW)
MDSRARDILVQASGWVVLCVGLALLVLPGPGILFVLAGLAILGRRHAWARSAGHKIRVRAAQWLDRLRPGRQPGPKEPAALPPAR